jgi:monoamine oxidase
MPSLVERFLAQIEPVFPGLRRRWNGKAAGSMAHLDRCWGGWYACYRPGQAGALGGHEGATQGNVFFAGEHCGRDAQGFMEAGAATGKVAGQAVAALLGNESRGKAEERGLDPPCQRRARAPALIMTSNPERSVQA